MKSDSLTLFFIVALTVFTSCNKKEDDVKIETSATIIVVDTDNKPISGMPVYGYTNDTWVMFGDELQFAQKNVVTESDGRAHFILDDIIGLFDVVSQETLFFTTHYIISGEHKTAIVAITIKEGENKSATIILN